MESINVFWFKKDLRVMDNPALQAALLDYTPTLLVYNFEPMLLKNDHYDNRHWQFISESLAELNQFFSQYNTKILICSCVGLQCHRSSLLVMYTNRSQLLVPSHPIRQMHSSGPSYHKYIFNRQNIADE